MKSEIVLAITKAFAVDLVLVALVFFFVATFGCTSMGAPYRQTITELPDGTVITVTEIKPYYRNVYQDREWTFEHPEGWKARLGAKNESATMTIKGTVSELAPLVKGAAGGGF